MSEKLTIIDDMKKLGLSEYEVKAYLTLLEEYPVNGYALSKNSAIPRSRIYDVLESLKNKQMVFEQLDTKTTLYYPLDPKLLIRKFQENFDEVFNKIDMYTRKIYSKQQDEKLVVINGRDNIIDFLSLLIGDAKERISVSLWEEELGDIAHVLDDAINRKVELRGIYFGKSNRYPQLIKHRRLERYLAEKKERYLTVVIDKTHVVSGVISRGQDSKVTWTKDIAFVEMSEDYIAHDVMVNLYATALGQQEKEGYEIFLDNVRKEYFKFTEEEFNNF